MAVEVDVAVDHAVLVPLGGSHGPYLARLFGGRRHVDDGGGMRVAHRVLSRIAFEFDSRPRQYDDYTIATWISDYGRLLSTRNFTLCDAAGREFGRAVSQWAMIDLGSRAAVDLSWVVSASTPKPFPCASVPAVFRTTLPSAGIVARKVKSTSCGSTR